MSDAPTTALLVMDVQSVVTLGDGCGDGDAELHRLLIERICARYGDVLTVEEWSSAITAAH